MLFVFTEDILQMCTVHVTSLVKEEEIRKEISVKQLWALWWPVTCDDTSTIKVPETILLENVLNVEGLPAERLAL